MLNTILLVKVVNDTIARRRRMLHETFGADSPITSYGDVGANVSVGVCQGGEEESKGGNDQSCAHDR